MGHRIEYGLVARNIENINKLNFMVTVIIIINQIIKMTVSTKNIIKCNIPVIELHFLGKLRGLYLILQQNNLVIVQISISF